MMFKNQLQELAQRSCYNMPSYSCIKEGPDHAPKFKASVSFNGEIFESPGYFATLRVAEHAAAEVALKDIQSRTCPQSLAKILDESGVCKNLLQENAQRAGVPLPVYNTRKSGPGHQPVFTCIVEVAAMQFTGEPAKTKKQAEKNAALAAWTALRKKAGRRSSAPVEDSDVTDEQEQRLIADILKSNLSDKPPIKSSPAALAENHHHRGGVSPALLPCTPLYIRHQSRAPPDARGSYSTPAPVPVNMPTAASMVGGPLYRPRHLNASWMRPQEPPQGHVGGPSPANPDRTGLLDNQAASLLSGNPHFPRQSHSSPHMHGHIGAAMRGGMPSSALRDNHSLPTFPTQPLLSQAVPAIPGLGMPMEQPLSGTTSHTNLAIRPGMAYQPRFVRSQYQPSAVGPAAQQGNGTWHAAAPQSGDAMGGASSIGGASPMWREPSASWSSSVDLPSAGSRRGMLTGQMPVGIPPVMATGSRQTLDLKDDDDLSDSQQVEHTARLIVNHLCLE